MARFFGTPPGVVVGQHFASRRALRNAGVHLPTQPGISGTKAEGADSIVLSGGYVDDEDHGDLLIYTGHGGQDAFSRQIKNQTFESPGNAGLVTSRVEGLPVRVSRGSRLKSEYAPQSGFQYDGLYEVTNHWLDRGAHDFQIARFELKRLTDQEPLFRDPGDALEPVFATTTVSRRIRDSQLARQVKHLYKDRCQVCNIVIPGIGGRTYSEGAHVRPLGRPHLGDDTLDNILCLCPNHHTQLDIGGMIILDDMSVVDTASGNPVASLRFAKSHRLEEENARYHRRMWTSLGT